jgi:dTDP-4-dehydrorhamnose reductase
MGTGTRPILVTGGSGQLASALAAQGGERVHLVGRPAFDFDRPETIASTFRAADPWLVVNAAAYTAVDAAETDEAAASTGTVRRNSRGSAPPPEFR